MNFTKRVLQVSMFVFLSTPFPLFATVSITEIMYDLPGGDSKHEWVEVMNGGAPVNLTEWKLFEGDSNHKIVAFLGGDTVPEGGYAILADNPAMFLADYPGFAGIVFDVALSGGLNNTNGETLTLRNAELSDEDSVTYSPAMGAAGDGNSLQKIAGSWHAFRPTPGNASDGTKVSTVSEEEDEPAVPVPPPVTNTHATSTTQTSTEALHQKAAVVAPEPAANQPENEAAPAKTSLEESLIREKKSETKKETPTVPTAEKAEYDNAIPEPENLAAVVALPESPAVDTAWLWYAGLIAVIMLGFYGVYLARKKTPLSEKVKQQTTTQRSSR